MLLNVFQQGGQKGLQKGLEGGGGGVVMIGGGVVVVVGWGLNEFW